MAPATFERRRGLIRWFPPLKGRSPGPPESPPVKVLRTYFGESRGLSPPPQISKPYGRLGPHLIDALPLFSTDVRRLLSKLPAQRLSLHEPYAPKALPFPASLSKVRTKLGGDVEGFYKP